MDDRDMREYLSVRETARRLGVHENTIRNWARQGILTSARVPGSRFHRFEAKEVERLARSRGSAVASIHESRRLVGPELVDATQLAAWAARLGSKGLFPRLIRRLLAASPGVSDLSIRAQEGIASPGWDGRVSSSRRSPWVPAGPSRWEFSADSNIRQKAQADYDKRTANPLGTEPAKTTFVFATPRRWHESANWERERRGDNVWRDVRVIDADDLEAWLEAVPAVHYWISEELGLRPRDAITLGHWWQRFVSRTKPPLPRDLLLAGRDKHVEELESFLQGEPAATGLQASSRDEAVGFLAAALAAGEDPGEQPVVIVSAGDVWDRLTSSGAPMVLVPTFDGADIAAAVAGGHHVITPLGRQDIPRGAVIALPRPDRQGAHQAFVDAGCGFDRANQLSALARRSLASLMRELAVDPRMSRPPWGAGDAADVLAPLLLVGAWSSSDEDRAIVSEIGGSDWTDVERHLKRWSLTEDPPFTFAGEGWHLTSPEEAFEVFAPLITAAMVNRWSTSVRRVLGETDPGLELSEEERWTASLRGVRRTYSETLRRGLAESMALLGAFGLEGPIVAQMTLADHVQLVVRGLLEQANADDTGLLWRSLSSELPLLAEAAPEEFLAAVETGLSGESPLLATMFRDSTNGSFLSSSSPHTGLLWALETLCWSNDFFLEALLTLGRLATLDPGGRLANRPAASLRAVLLPWVPYTAAPADQRLSALRELRKRHPEVGWQLLLNLMPKHHDWSSPTSSPRFRDWKPDREGVTVVEWATAIVGLVDQALEELEREPARWIEVIERLGGLPLDQRSRLIRQLQAATKTGAFSPEGSLALWRKITEETAHHRAFPAAQWSMDDESLSKLEEVASMLQPTDAVERHAELFDWRPRLPGVDRFDRPGYDEALAAVRKEAVRLVLDSAGVKGIERLAHESPQPRFVGISVADVAGNELAQEILTWLGRDDKQGEVASGWAQRMADTRGRKWIVATAANIDELSIAGQSAFLRALPSGKELERLLERVSEPVRDDYWRSINPLVFLDGERAAFAAEELLAHGRPGAAVELLATCLHGSKAVPPYITAELISEALWKALSLDPADRWIQSFDYAVESLLDHLTRLGADEKTLAQLEWSYFPLLEHSRRAPTLYSLLKRDPAFFADLVSQVYRGKSERRRQLDDEAAARARNAWSVLDSWREIPGLREDGSIDRDHLHQWVRQARLLLAERDRGDIGDEQIGQLLSGSPHGADGAWPAEPVRELIEDIGSRELETGLHIGHQNSRGVTMRGVYDGGQQEHELAARYRGWGRITVAQWPRTSRLLRGLADGYEREARRMDAEAEARASRD